MSFGRIYITGASGTGVTTLGTALAAERGSPQIDVDGIFWEPTEPPFQTPQPLAQRRELLLDAIHATEQWVLSGSLDGWGDIAIPRMELVVFLAIPAAMRLQRLHERELTRYPAEWLEPGGAMHESSTTFMAWAERYDTAGLEQRSRIRHDAWLANLSCPVLRIEGDTTVAERVTRVLAAMG